jgi:energy-converting hydrogenase Eha subunit C
MYIGLSLFLGALGAILRYAVADQIENVDLATVGLILMIAAAVGLVVSLLQMSTRRRRYVAVDDAPVVRQPY